MDSHRKRSGISEMGDKNLQFSLVFIVIAWRLATTGTAEFNRFNIWKLNISLPILVHGLDYTFYDEICPEAEGIVRSRVNYFIDQDITQAAGLLRLFYQDCFVKGCDASVLLRGSARGPWDISATPDQRLRAEAFGIIDDIKYHLELACPQVVSCADIVALAARDAILAQLKAKGRYFSIPTGRRDSRVLDTEEDVSNSMPKPTWNVSLLLQNFKSRGLDVTDLVALSGAHTIGKAHCSSFANRLRPIDPRMSREFARNLLEICPTENSTNTTAMDSRSPKFDNKYYRDLVNNRGLFTSDEDLFYDARTRELVWLFDHSKFFFFTQFAVSAIKMSQLGILTGMEGEIRVNCWEPNYIEPSASPAPSSTPPVPSPIPSPFIPPSSSSIPPASSPIPSPFIPPSSAPEPSTTSPTPTPLPEPDNPPPPPIHPYSYTTMLEYSANNIWLYIFLCYVFF